MFVFWAMECQEKCFWDLLTFRKTSIKSMLKKLESRTFQINYLAQSWHQIKKALTEWKVQKLSRWNWKCSGYRFCLPENGPREQTVWIRVRWVMELETWGMKLVVMSPSRAGLSHSSSWRIFSLARLGSWPFSLQLGIENWLKNELKFQFSVEELFCIICYNKID